MTRRTLDQTLDFISGLDRARTADEICAALLVIVSRFGFDQLLAGTVPTPGASKDEQQSHVLLSRWPSEWAERYFSNDYLFHDPAIKHLRADRTPLAWRDLEPSLRDDSAARRIMDEAADFRLRVGYTVPVAMLEGDVAGFSLAGEAAELAPDERGMLTLLANYALGRAIALRSTAPAMSAVQLTPREREVLQWAAEGKSEWEIGAILGISEHGADKHLRSVRQKLGTQSRAGAVAQGIRRGLIR